MKVVSKDNVGTPIVFKWTRPLDPAATLTLEVIKPQSKALVSIPATVHPESSAWFLAYSRAGDFDELGAAEVRGREVVAGVSDVRTLPDFLEVV